MQSPAGLHAASPGNVEIIDGKQAGQQVVRPLVLTLPPPREYRIHPFPSSFLQAQATAMLKQMEWKAEVTGRKADVLQVTAPHPPPNTELVINGHRMSIQDMDTIRAERKRKEEEKRLKKEHRAHEDAIAALLAALQGIKGTGGRGGGRGYTAKEVVVPVAHLHAVLKVIAQDRAKQTSPTAPVATATAPAPVAVPSSANDPAPVVEPSSANAPATAAVPSSANDPAPVVEPSSANAPATAAVPSSANDPTPADAPAPTPAPAPAAAEEMWKQMGEWVQREEAGRRAFEERMSERICKIAATAAKGLNNNNNNSSNNSKNSNKGGSKGMSDDALLSHHKAQRERHEIRERVSGIEVTLSDALKEMRQAFTPTRNLAEEASVQAAAANLQAAHAVHTADATEAAMLEGLASLHANARDLKRTTAADLATLRRQAKEESEIAQARTHAVGQTADAAAAAAAAAAADLTTLRREAKEEAEIAHARTHEVEQTAAAAAAAAAAGQTAAAAVDLATLRREAEEEAELTRGRTDTIERLTGETAQSTAVIAEAAAQKIAEMDAAAKALVSDTAEAVRQQSLQNVKVEKVLGAVVQKLQTPPAAAPKPLPTIETKATTPPTRPAPPAPPAPVALAITADMKASMPKQDKQDKQDPAPRGAGASRQTKVDEVLNMMPKSRETPYPARQLTLEAWGGGKKPRQ